MPSATPSGRLEENLVRLSWAFRQHREYIRKKYQAAPQELELIQFAVHYGPRKMREVADHFHLKLSTLTSIVDKAEQRGFVTRSTSKIDRRVVLLDVSPKGRKIYDAYHAFLQQTVQRMSEVLPPETFTLFVEGIEAFNNISLGSSNGKE